MTFREGIAYRLYTPKQVALACFLGSPVAGAVLLASNYRKWGEERKANLALVTAAAVLGGLIWLGLQFGQSVSAAGLFVPILMDLVAKRLQGSRVDSARANGTKVASWWAAVGIGMAGAAVMVALILVFANLTRRPVKGPYVIGLQDVARVFDKLQSDHRNEDFGAFIFFDGNPTRENAVNLQFSIEHGRIGFDWVLRAAVNIRDQKRFREFAHDQGYSVAAEQLNGVNYFRVENGDLPGLCKKVMQAMYGAPPDGQLGLMVSGITWP